MKTLYSIKSKILLSYVIIISVAVVLSIVIIGFNYYITDRYAKVNNNMAQIQALHDEASGLVNDAYKGFQTNYYSDYEQRLARVRVIEKNLDLKLVGDQKTFIAYRGVKNSLEVVIKNIALARKSIQNSDDLDSISNFYKENSIQYGYVDQSITELILTETVNLSNITQQTVGLQTVLTYVIIAIVILGVVSLIILAYIFSNKLADPLINLAVVSRKITPDNLIFNVDQKTLTRQDEVGDLYRAFKGMVDQVNLRVEEVNKSYIELEKAKQVAEAKLQDIKSLNSVMVGRELKMIELKKEIESLKKESGA